MADPKPALLDPTPDVTLIVDDGDIDEESKDTFARYLSIETHGKTDPTHKNEFPIKQARSEIATHNPLGIPVETPDTNADRFLEQEDLVSYKNSQYFLATEQQIGEFLKKGKHADDSVQNGHKFLKDLTSDSDAVKYVSAVLKGNNRFEPSNTFIDNSSVGGTRPDGGMIASLQHGIPAIDSDTKATNLKLYKKNSAVISNSVVEKVGASLSLRSTGELDAVTEADPDSVIAQLGSLLPGEMQLINPIGPKSVDRFDAAAVLSDMMRAAGISGEDVDALKTKSSAEIASSASGKIAGMTFGNLNNFVEGFANSLAPVGMIALNVTLLAATFIGIEAILLLIGSLIKESRLQIEDTGAYVRGTHASVAETNVTGIPIVDTLIDVGTLLGFHPVSFDFKGCVNKGIFVFFRLDNGAIEAINSITIDQPGFYVIFQRMLTRSIQTLAATFQELSANNILEVVNGITSVINALKTSRLIKIINFFAQLGNTRLRIERDGFKDLDRVYVDEQIDSSADTNAHEKSRTAGTTKLSWRTSTSPSLLHIPASVFGTDRMHGDKTARASNYLGAVDYNSSRLEITKGQGISPEIRRSIEAKLEAEYVPFYFHDTRTNEIISFHAFLNRLEDSYSPEYGSETGFGRVEPTLNYKSTSRRLGLGFMCVATNTDDFDILWTKTNKLTTLVYPKWSRGRTITNVGTDGKKSAFVAPFSQVMTSGPLIRLRVGDVIKGNYSRFALARLFGLADTASTVQIAQFYISRMQNGIFSLGDSAVLRCNGSLGSSAFEERYPVHEDSSTGVSLSALAGAAPFFDTFFSDQNTNLPLKVISPTTVIVTDILVPGQKYAVQLETGADKKYVVHAGDLSIDYDFIARVNRGENVQQQDVQYPAQSFLSREANSVVRSFEDNGGKGLAGMITSLSFDWYTDVVWETEIYGSRAPKLFKVTLDFSVIHDIAPGLDDEGFNRAPIYNVGRVINGICGNADDQNDFAKSQFDVRQRVNSFKNNKSKQ